MDNNDKKYILNKDEINSRLNMFNNNNISNDLTQQINRINDLVPIYSRKILDNNLQINYVSNPKTTNNNNFLNDK